MDKRENHKTRAVIFDMDGTLIDTEKHYIRIGMELSKEMGYEIPLETLLSMRSLNRKFSKPMLLEKYGEGFDFEYFHSTRRARLKEALEQYGIEKKPGVDEILDDLKKDGYRTAVATATDFERAASFLTQIGIFDKFDKVISVSNVENGKPMPDVYLEACRQLGEDPKDCVAVEDSSNGVKSAYRAGMRVIMVPDLSKPDEEILPMLAGVAGTLADIKKYI